MKKERTNNEKLSNNATKHGLKKLVHYACIMIPLLLLLFMSYSATRDYHKIINRVNNDLDIKEAKLKAQDAADVLVINYGDKLHDNIIELQKQSHNQLPDGRSSLGVRITEKGVLVSNILNSPIKCLIYIRKSFESDFDGAVIKSILVINKPFVMSEVFERCRLGHGRIFLHKDLSGDNTTEETGKKEMKKKYRPMNIEKA